MSDCGHTIYIPTSCVYQCTNAGTRSATPHTAHFTVVKCTKHPPNTDCCAVLTAIAVFATDLQWEGQTFFRQGV
jgi:hypothetical protein